ncbi:MAG: hypothetical protein IIB67_05550 [Proteobacteria bacterium]|nr:hypothetical protein [Pseudomonadota bacterium]
MFFNAMEAINSTLISNTSNILQGVARVIALPWLTDLSKWYLVKTDGVIRPIIFQDREPIDLDEAGDRLETRDGVTRTVGLLDALGCLASEDP